MDSIKMGGFNFVSAFKKQMAKAVHGDPVKRYAACWEQVRSAVPKRGAPDQKAVEEVKRLLKAMLGLLVEEMKDASASNDEALRAAPPIYELMLKHDVFKQLCELAKRPGFDVPVLHHLVDVVLFVMPLFGNYNKVTAAVIDLLQYTEGRIQLWEANEQTSFEYTQRCLAHGFIQLVHAISWQLRHELSAVECVDFFFVDRRKLQFDDAADNSADNAVASCFVLVDFSLPFLRRKQEVVAAQEVDFTHDLRDPADLAQQIYTSEVALDALINILNIPHRHVDAYLASKADLIAEMLCKSLQDLCQEYIVNDPDSHDEDFNAVILAQIRHRVDVLNEAARHPCSALTAAFVRSFTSRIVLKTFKKHLNGLDDAANRAPILRLWCLIVDMAHEAPFCPLLVAAVLGASPGAIPMEGEEMKLVLQDNTVMRAILQSIAGGEDPEEVQACLGVVAKLLETRPASAADALLAPALSGHPLSDANAAAVRALSAAAVNALFHDSPAARCPNGLDPKYQHDQCVAHFRLQSALAADTGAAFTAAPVQWVPGVAPAAGDDAGPSLLPSLVQRLGNILDTPLDSTLALLHVLTLCIHLNCDALTWYILGHESREYLTVVQALRSLRIVIDGVRQEDELHVFKYNLEEVRRNCGIVRCEDGYEGIMDMTPANQVHGPCVWPPPHPP
eukprot:TRINITY_DN2094_c1_g1_i2.p1 TRINITY_DN2094_c1_g1~~TRINITY_DN2094_c1_g1_i2.p1  ORF type:complete len:721 (+),score=284.92 TRINITY_DN2094_c1_g1_i2:137-2164(+)